MGSSFAIVGVAVPITNPAADGNDTEPRAMRAISTVPVSKYPSLSENVLVIPRPILVCSFITTVFGAGCSTANAESGPAFVIPIKANAGTKFVPLSTTLPEPFTLCLSNSTERTPPPHVVNSMRTNSLLSVTICSGKLGCSGAMAVSLTASAGFSTWLSVAACGTALVPASAVATLSAFGLGG